MRYKEFNRNKVLETCIPLLWKDGFKACSINDIVYATGVNRYSLYEEFDSKEGILHAAMELYRQRYSSINFEILKEKGVIEDVLKEFFLSFLTDSSRQQGCFIIYMATELADSDEIVRSLLRKYLDELAQEFINLLERNPGSEEDNSFYAKHLIGLFCTFTSFCLIHSKEARLAYITNSINIIFNKKRKYASSPQ